MQPVGHMPLCVPWARGGGRQPFVRARGWGSNGSFPWEQYFALPAPLGGVEDVQEGLAVGDAEHEEDDARQDHSLRRPHRSGTMSPREDGKEVECTCHFVDPFD